MREYKALNKKIQDAEFNLKAEIGMRRRKVELEKYFLFEFWALIY